MSSLTTNLKLVKPELQDNITPTIFADNFDKIDAALEGVSGGALSLEEIEASTNLDGKIPSAAALKEVNNSISELSSNIEWKYWGTTTAKNALTLPEKYNELNLVVYTTGNWKSINSLIISRGAIEKSVEKNKLVTMTSGGNFTALSFTDTTVSIDSYKSGTENAPATWTLEVWYR